MLEALEHLACEGSSIFRPYLTDLFVALNSALESNPEDLAEPILFTITKILESDENVRFILKCRL